MARFIKETPWDKRNFGIDTYELTASSEEALEEAEKVNGHFTLKVDPLENKESIVRHGFYYTDTMIEPVCSKDKLKSYDHENIRVSRVGDLEVIMKIAEEVFTYGRFHRDFHIPSKMANMRYANWVKDLYDKDQVFFLSYEGEMAAFYAYEDEKILLIGLKKEFMQRGLTKYMIQKACQAQFELGGYSHLKTSISAANLPSLNLFLSLGFKLTRTFDVYHKLNGPAPEEE
ncbi:N-acetyltransferase [Bacillus sp. Marseille-Q3570]|uniref:N-acetyltransferase n=1 Tax=Bacillus sp. Marseille-Q3570 TaxID=2963522 RepID=UPI0021B751B8|nr:N-acetyltransferase [Bacillus sp. Marseille-Q3570]